MYKCIECGHIFDEGEQAIRVEHHSEIPGGADENFSVCPVCGGEYEGTYHCEKCGGEFLWDELNGSSYCDECLKDAASAENFTAFAKWSDEGLSERDVHMVEHLMMTSVYFVDDDSFTASNDLLREHMEKEFSKKAEDEKFKETIWRYLKEFDLTDDFAEWLHDEEAKK